MNDFKLRRYILTLLSFINWQYQWITISIRAARLNYVSGLLSTLRMNVCAALPGLNTFLSISFIDKYFIIIYQRVNSLHKVQKMSLYWIELKVRVYSFGHSSNELCIKLRLDIAQRISNYWNSLNYIKLFHYPICIWNITCFTCPRQCSTQSIFIKITNILNAALSSYNY